MARFSRRQKIVIITLVAFVLIALGAVFVPIEMPHFQLAPERPFGEDIPITNTMIGAWLTILVMGGIAYAATRKMRLVPHGLQNVMEAAVLPQPSREGKLRRLLHPIRNCRLRQMKRAMSHVTMRKSAIVPGAVVYCEVSGF